MGKHLMLCHDLHQTVHQAQPQLVRLSHTSVQCEASITFIPFIYFINLFLDEKTFTIPAQDYSQVCL